MKNNDLDFAIWPVNMFHSELFMMVTFFNEICYSYIVRTSQMSKVKKRLYYSVL